MAGEEEEEERNTWTQLTNNNLVGELNHFIDSCWFVRLFLARRNEESKLQPSGS